MYLKNYWKNKKYACRATFFGKIKSKKNKIPSYRATFFWFARVTGNWDILKCGLIRVIRYPLWDHYLFLYFFIPSIIYQINRLSWVPPSNPQCNLCIVYIYHYCHNITLFIYLYIWKWHTVCQAMRIGGKLLEAWSSTNINIKLQRSPLPPHPNPRHIDLRETHSQALWNTNTR